MIGEIKQTDIQHRYGKSFSWTMLNEHVAIKKTDHDFFSNKESGIPADKRWFFDAQSLSEKHNKIQIKLIYKERPYDGYVVLSKDNRARIIWYADLKREFIKHYRNEDDYPLARFEKTNPNEFFVEFIEDIAEKPDEVDPLESVFIPQTEGKKKEYYVTRYERNHENRKKALLIHGTRCMVCGFDFESFYGEVGSGFIEVHHIKPLSEKGEEVTVNPETDLVCLCSNCHSIIHRKKNGVYTVEEIKEMVETQKNVHKR